jgi:hypothetical protein
MSTDAEKHVWENEDGDLVVVLKLPGGPREYVIADVDAETGLWVHSITERTRKANSRLEAGEDEEQIDAELHLSDEQETDLYTRTLGGTFQDLAADGVRWKQTRLMGQIAYAWIVRGLAGARAAWEAEGSPEPNRQARRAAAKKSASGSKTSASGGSARTTRARASTTRTRTQS